MSNNNLQMLFDVFEGLLNKFRIDGDEAMLKVVKQILEILHMEKNARLKGVKLKGCNCIPTLEELGIDANKVKGIEEMWKKMRQKITEDSMSMNMQNGDLYKFAQRIRDADPEFQQAQAQKEAMISDAEDKMMINSLNTTDPTTASLAIRNLGQHLTRKYGEHASEKLHELLEGETE